MNQSFIMKNTGFPTKDDTLETIVRNMFRPLETIVRNMLRPLETIVRNMFRPLETIVRNMFRPFSCMQGLVIW